MGSTLGARTGAFARVVQVVGYTLLAVTGVQAIGIQLMSFQFTGDDFAPLLDSWLLPLYAVTAIVIAAVAAFALPGRVTASIAAILATAGLLIYFYLGLAVIARVLSGTDPLQIGGYGAPTGLGVGSTLVILATSLAGFEVITTRTRHGSSAGWPMGLAIGAVTVCAVVVWFADHLGDGGSLHVDAEYFALIVSDMYGGAGRILMTIGGLSVVAAAVLALLWGIAQLTPDAVFAGLVALMAVLTVVLCRLSVTVGYVGALVLVVLYVVVVEANARIPKDSVITWWLRLVMPCVLAAVVLLPLLNAGFSLDALVPIFIAAPLVAVAAAVAAAGPYTDSTTNRFTPDYRSRSTRRSGWTVSSAAWFESVP